MKLKNYILALIITGLFFACSDSSDSPIDTPPQKTSLSIRTETDRVSTKVDNNTISKLDVIIIYKNGDIIIPESGVGTEKKEISVEAGNAQVVVLANFTGQLPGSTSTLKDVLEHSVDLENENENLTMSSKVYNIAFTPGKHHYLGYGSSGSNIEGIYIDAGNEDPVQLYRNVARTKLAGLTLAEGTHYNIPVSFTLKSVFMANVKSQSHLASNDAWGVVEKENPENWYYGHDANENLSELDGAYISTDKDKRKNFLPNLRETFQEENKLSIEDNSTSWTKGSKYLYVYENLIDSKTPKGLQTYLIVHGDYKVKENGKEKEYLDRYWTIPVNNMGTSIYDPDREDLEEHKGIKRNYSYDIHLTITGPGSDNPYEPDATINLNAEIIVKDWFNVINIDEGIK